MTTNEPDLDAQLHDLRMELEWELLPYLAAIVDLIGSALAWITRKDQ